MAIENNLIELITNIHPHGYGQPWGMRIASVAPSPPYTFLSTVIRGNIVRHADNAVDPTPVPVGIGVYNCENVLIEANVVEINYYRVAFNNSSKNVKCFDNRTPAGELIRGYNFEANVAADEIATRLEDVSTLAIKEER